MPLTQPSNFTHNATQQPVSAQQWRPENANDSYQNVTPGKNPQALIVKPNEWLVQAGENMFAVYPDARFKDAYTAVEPA